MDRTRRVKAKREISVCEKSMQVVANMFTLPTLYFAQKTLRSSTTGKALKNLSGYGVYEKGPLMYNQVHGRRSQEPQRRTKYLVKSVESNDHGSASEKIETLEDDINKLATKYITETRNRICSHAV